MNSWTHGRKETAYVVMEDVPEFTSPMHKHTIVSYWDERKRASVDEFETYCALIALMDALHIRTERIAYVVPVTDLRLPEFTQGELFDERD